MFHSQKQTSQLNCKLHYEYATVELDLSCLFTTKHLSLYFTSLLCT
jgi:hypothetical protein